MGIRLLVPSGRSGAPGWLALSVPRPLRARVTVNVVQGIGYLAIWGLGHVALLHPLPRATRGGRSHLHFSAEPAGLCGISRRPAGALVTRRAVSDARVMVREDGLRVGGQAEVRVEQDLLGDAVLERVRVGLVCEKTTGSGKSSQTAVQWERWATPKLPRPRVAARHRGRRELPFTETLPVPADQHASTAAGDDPATRGS